MGELLALARASRSLTSGAHGKSVAWLAVHAGILANGLLVHRGLCKKVGARPFLAMRESASDRGTIFIRDSVNCYVGLFSRHGNFLFYE